MAGVDVQIDASQLVQQLEEFITDVKGFPMEIIGETFIAAIDDFLASEGEGGWDDFSEATLRRNPKRAGGKLLQDTGLLAQIQSETGSDYWQGESPAPYAKWHVNGTKNMPQRDFLDINTEETLDEVIVHFMEEVAG